MSEELQQKWGVYGGPYHKRYFIRVGDLLPGMWFSTNPDSIPFFAARQLCRSVSPDVIKYQSYMMGKLHPMHQTPDDASQPEDQLKKCWSIRKDDVVGEYGNTATGTSAFDEVAEFILDEQPYICVKQLQTWAKEKYGGWEEWQKAMHDLLWPKKDQNDVQTAN